MIVEFLERQPGQLLGFDLGFATVGYAAAGVQGAAREEREAYKLPNIASNGSSEGSADGAAERDSGETV